MFGAVALAGEGYAFDAMSRTHVDGSADTFGYDGAGQVIAASYTNNMSAQGFTYNLAGNP